jgi:hypothetical protein
MDLLIDALDRGLDINGFENGFGETITTWNHLTMVFFHFIFLKNRLTVFFFILFS